MLTEDNAGTLMIGRPSIGWWDVTELQKTSFFKADAQAILDDNVADWTVQHYPHDSNWYFRKDVKIVATHGPHSTYRWHAPIKDMGSAAKNYLKLNLEWAS